MIGKELVLQLEELGAEVFKFDYKRYWNEYGSPEDCIECGKRTRYPIDVRFQSTIHKIFTTFNPEFVFHLFGVKGNPKKTNEKPASFMIPMLQGDTNIIEGCQKFAVKRMLYTSSIAVENPETDKYPAWAKQTAETLIDAMRVQYPDGTKYCVVRPANVYGRFDNFDNPDAMVITSLIAKSTANTSLLSVWGDGTQVRDFINAKDVARGMIKVMEEMPDYPVNLCSSKPVEIGQIADIIANYTGKEVQFEPDKPTGEKRRVMKLNYDIEQQVDLEEGIKEAIDVRRSSSS